MIVFAFYGRVGSRWLQDPQGSRRWQLHRARALIEPHGGVIVAEYFDVGRSRVLPWHRRPRASQLLADLVTGSGVRSADARRRRRGSPRPGLAPPAR